ncbi:MAG TPA: PAS domain-containing protein, partial [Chitinophagaceae bacterium]|nr:PAS domain-containing protein [Chitinophagaceae bacterium]
ELVTINAELQMRNDQLAEAQEYADAVFNTIQKAIVVLDKDLRVKSANKAFFRIFRVREEDTQSVLIYELGNRQWDIPELRILLEEILSANTEFHGLEVTHTFQHIGRKHMLLNAHRLTQTSNHTRHFILLAIDDITEQRQLESTLKEREEYITNLTDHIPVMIWTSGPDKLRQFFNRTWLEFTGRRIDQEGANGWMENIHKDDLEIYFKAVNEGYEQGKAFTLEYRLRRHDGKYCTIRDNAQPLFGQDGRVTGYIGSCILVQS